MNVNNMKINKNKTHQHKPAVQLRHRDDFKSSQREGQDFLSGKRDASVR